VVEGGKDVNVGIVSEDFPRQVSRRPRNWASLPSLRWVVVVGCWVLTSKKLGRESVEDEVPELDWRSGVVTSRMKIPRICPR
jgi:hypothetical protein